MTMSMTMTDPEMSNLKMSLARHLIVLITGHALKIPFLPFNIATSNLLFILFQVQVFDFAIFLTDLLQIGFMMPSSRVEIVKKDRFIKLLSSKPLKI